MKIHRRLIFALLLILTLLPALALAWQGKVVGISDGDTITVMHEGKGEKIRLYGVDTPESHQDFGTKAKQFTSDMVFGKIVEVQRIDTDRYGRTVGLVTIDGVSLNRELIRNGFAWVYAQYCKESFCTEWKQFENEAKLKKVGLWSLENPIPPWQFRHPKKGGGSSEAKIEEGNQGSQSNPGSITYHGNIDSRIFHQPGCRSYNCKNCSAIFRTREEAVKAGFKPCGQCKP